MILEELVGYFVALVSSLTQTPPISREALQREDTLIFEDNPEREEVYDGLIHREYEQEPMTEVPYYEEDIPVLTQANHDQPGRRRFSESFFRSCKVNIGLVIAVVFILSLLNIGIVYVDLNTTNACIEWRHQNLSVPSSVRILQIVGISVALLPLFTWFSVCVVMLWGFNEFKKNYLKHLLVCQLVTGSITCVYRITVFDKIITAYTVDRLPGNFLFLLSITCGAYLVARKFKQVNPTTSYSLFHIFFMLWFAFFISSLLAPLYTFVLIKYFRKTENKVRKTLIAALTPGALLPVTAIAKYLVLRKSSEVFTPDRAFLLCYFVRGASITLYRTMQSGFKNIWLYIGLSLLHGVSNVLSKATLNFRIRIWRFIIKWLNRTCCGPRLEVRPLDSPRIRRLNADLEIQNILFEYTAVILSQAYLSCYLVMNFDVPAWQVIKDSLTRIAISVPIDFAFNIISIFIQVHFYDIPMTKVWVTYWRRHVIANAVIIIVIVSYFGASLVSVFTMLGHKYILEEYKLRDCISVF